MSTVLEPPAGAALRHGHCALLETLRDFALDLDAAGPGAAVGDARALVAFLRHGLLPFARREEALLAGHGDASDGAAFEHAFLAAEIDALAGETRALADAPPRTAGAALAAVRRRVHRLEAVLELHVARAEDEDAAAAHVPASGPEIASTADPDADREGERAGHARAMGDDEVRAFLAGRDWGVLATVGDGEPYAVPVSFGFDGAAFYVAMGPGRKAENLAARPAASLTVVEVRERDRWRSVVACGPAAPVEGLSAKLRALDVIRRQRVGAHFSPADLARAARARVWRISPRELTGRTCG